MNQIFDQETLLKIFYKTEAILKGHFKLSSGLHSDTYIQCAKVMQYPELNSIIAGIIADKFRDVRLDGVIGPAIGGIILSYEVARKLGVKGIFAEREEGKMKLRRGFEINKGENYLIVEDVITTGGSVKEIIELIKEREASIAGVASIIDRSGGKVKLHPRQYSILVFNIKNYKPEGCPLCKQGIPLTAPGSKHIR